MVKWSDETLEEALQCSVGNVFYTNKNDAKKEARLLSKEYNNKLNTQVHEVSFVLIEEF